MPDSPRWPAPLRGAYRQWLRLAYRGDRVVCPCCLGRFRRFLPFGVVRREHARCPGCGSLERHRLLWLWLERKTDLLTAPHRLLHVAPEPLLAEQLRKRPRLAYVSVDLESSDARVRMDATRLAFRDGAFDVILCLHVLEHVPDDRMAMRELRRVLARGGWALLQSPVDPERAQTFEDPSVRTARDRERVFGQSDHVRIYGRDYSARLAAAGFQVEDSPFAAELSRDEAARFGIDPTETLTICT